MAKVPAAMLTTSDNPFNPDTQFDAWNRYDQDHGYCCLGLVARFAKTSPELSDADNRIEYEAAIDRIIDLGLVFEDKNGKNITFEKVIIETEEDIPA